MTLGITCIMYFVIVLFVAINSVQLTNNSHSESIAFYLILMHIIRKPTSADLFQPLSHLYNVTKYTVPARKCQLFKSAEKNTHRNYVHDHATVSVIAYYDN